MTRFLPLVVLVAVLAAVAAVAPGPASANDAAVVASVKKSSVIITPKAQALGTLMKADTSSAKALATAKTFTRTALQGAAAISTPKASTKTGANLKLLVTRAFVNYAKAGELLIKAMQMVRAGKTADEVTQIVNQDVTHADNGSIQLTKASALIRKVGR
jgi:hypothetical protein